MEMTIPEMKHKHWRLILNGPGEASWNMAVDEAISRSCQKGLSPPTLRIYAWLGPAVTIGRFQDINSLKGIGAADWETGPVVRRITGGGTVFHGRDLTFSLASSLVSGNGQTAIPRRPRAAFMATIGSVKTGIRKLGLNVEWAKALSTPSPPSPDCFSSSNSFELSYQGIKILGCAQRRWKSGLLQQGSIPLNTFQRKLGSHYHDEDIRLLLAQGIQAGFEEEREIRFVAADLTQQEQETARSLATGKYAPL